MAATSIKHRAANLPGLPLGTVIWPWTLPRLQWHWASIPGPSSTRQFHVCQTKLRQRSTPASYYRGGTSRGVIFHEHDLPQDPATRRRLFLQVMGSPDPYGRQLDGMGAGISSLSKICIIKPSSHPGADVDYTFVGIGIERDEVDYQGNCGNMSAAVGPFAVDEGLVGGESGDGACTVRILNTNTGVLIESKVHVEGGEAVSKGDFTVDGVGGTGAPIQLDFMNPGGSKTGKLLPTGAAVDTIAGYQVSCVDAANPVVFVRAADLGVDPTILPNDFNKLPDKLALLEEIRRQGAVRMGMIRDGEEPPRVVPKIAIVAPRRDQRLLSGETMDGAKLDIVVRFISDTQPHRAIPLTGALCTAAAAKITGSVVQQCLPDEPVSADMISIGHPSGKVEVNAKVDASGGIESATVLRTARRIMKGEVFWDD